MGNPAAKEHRWRLPTLELLASLIILAGTVVFLYPQTASWFSQKEQSRVTVSAQQSLAQPPNDDSTYRDQEIARARAYNDALASGAIFRANTNLATGEGVSTDPSLDYEQLLAITDAGFMGRLRYDALTIDLPVYHGTSDAVLERGVGHLEGTSLPVGGQGTRSVLTAHRGLPSATLFNDLNKAAVGDVFTVSVLDQVLTYRVFDVQVVDPDATASILPEAGEDLITLVTCTPLGINSHRILVTGERITPTPIEQVEAAAATPELPGFPWWAAIFGAVVSVLIAYVGRAGRVRARRHRPDEVPIPV